MRRKTGFLKAVLIVTSALCAVSGITYMLTVPLEAVSPYVSYGSIVSYILVLVLMLDPGDD